MDTIDPAYYTAADGDGHTKAARKAAVGLCQPFYADNGRPGLLPGRYFRLLLIGHRALPRDRNGFHHGLIAAPNQKIQRIRSAVITRVPLNPLATIC